MLELCLKNIRKKNNITLSELSNRSGFSISYISELENGIKNNPTLDVVSCLANSLHVCPLDLLFHKCDECYCCKN